MSETTRIIINVPSDMRITAFVKFLRSFGFTLKYKNGDLIAERKPKETKA